VHQVGHYPEFHQDARSTKHKKEEMNLQFQDNALLTCVNRVQRTPWLFFAFGKTGRFTNFENLS
jgi:hypothetical protein